MKVKEHSDKQTKYLVNYRSLQKVPDKFHVNGTMPKILERVPTTWKTLVFVV